MKLTIKEIVAFALLGALMFVSKVAMEFLPNIHLVAVLTATYTVVYRQKALFPLYVYVFLDGLFSGFGMWWLPYLYIWTVLWGVVMLLPRTMKPAVAAPVYMAVCGLHGLLFGTLYAPAQALMYHLSFKATVTWVIAGLPFDAIQAVGNFCLAALVLPLVSLLRRVDKAAI